MYSSPARSPRGFTLVELLVVVGILTLVAALVLPKVDNVTDYAGINTTQQSMRAVQDVIIGTRDDPGYIGTVGSLPVKIDDLFVNHANVPPYNPLNKKGFRANGYLQSSGAVYPLQPTVPTVPATGFENTNYFYVSGADTAIMDAWNHPIVIQYDTNTYITKPRCRLISAGPDGRIDTPANSINAVGDDIILPLYTIVAGDTW